MASRKPVDVVWKHFTMKNENGKKLATCSYCKNASYVNNATRMKEHLGKCLSVPQTIRDQYSSVNTHNCENVQKGTERGKISFPAVQSTQDVSVPCTSSTILNNSVNIDSLLRPQKVARIDSYFDNISPAQSLEYDRLLARFIYAEGLPFRLVESPYFLNLFQHLRPSYKPPSRFQLGNSLLDAENELLTADRETSLAKCNSFCIISDGWSTCDNRSLINFLVACPEIVYLKTVDTTDNSHTAEYISNEITIVIQQLNPDRVLGVITDNAANMKASWRILCEEFNHLQCFGCCAHTLNLLIKDLCKITLVSDLIDEVSLVTKFFHYKSRASAVLRRITLNSMGVSMSITMPISTRWGSQYLAIAKLIKLRDALELCAIDESLRSLMPANLRQLILNSDFWERLKACNSLMNPLMFAICLVESDQSNIGFVVKMFADIRQFMENKSFQPLMPNNDNELLVNIVERRALFCLAPVHLLSHLLDPRFLGSNLSAEQDNTAKECLLTIAAWLKINVEEIMTELAHFLGKSGFWESEAVWIPVHQVPPVVWWKGICKRSSLSKVAASILGLPCTTAPAERNWKSHKKQIYSTRCRLGTPKLVKLVNIAEHLKLQNRKQTVKTTVSLNGWSAVISETNEANQFFRDVENWIENSVDDAEEISESVDDDIIIDLTAFE